MSVISEQVKELEEAADVYGDEDRYLLNILLQATTTIESLSAKLQAANMERSAGRCINENTYYIKRSKKKDVIVSIMYNRADNKYHFVNLTERHICSCGFCTIDEAIADMEKQKKEGAIDDFYKIERPKADCGGGWIPCKERLPEEKINPITQDFYEYQVTFESDDVADIRHYKFGNGHWWNFGEIMDNYVIAWRQNIEPYHEP